MENQDEIIYEAGSNKFIIISTEDGKITKKDWAPNTIKPSDFEYEEDGFEETGEYDEDAFEEAIKALTKEYNDVLKHANKKAINHAKQAACALADFGLTAISSRKGLSDNKQTYFNVLNVDPKQVGMELFSS